MRAISKPLRVGIFITKLATIKTPHQRASILKPERLPAFEGEEEENLVCGGCAAVVCRGVSQMTTKTRFASPFQLIIICPQCATKNVLPSALATPP